MHSLTAIAALATALIAGRGPAPAGPQERTGPHGVRVFSKVPPVGVHPRVLMSPEDLPTWRQHVNKTYRGESFFAQRYRSARIEQLAAVDPRAAGEELLKAYPYTDPGSNHHLLFATLDVLYHQDSIAAKKVCRAVANFARVVLARSQYDPQWGRIETNIGQIQGLTGIPANLSTLWRRGGSDFALAYDYLYSHMTPGERDVCRRALSVATKELVTWGMGFPRGRAVSNWYGYHGELGPMLLAIEGEEGFHREQWDSFREMIRNWISVQLYDTGGANEDGYVGNVAMREGQFSLIAMARRGENFYDTPQIRNYWKWAVLSLVPGEDTGTSVGYTSAALAPYESSPVLARWAMPGDANVNFFFRRFKGKDYRRNNRWQYAPMSTLLCMNWEDTATLPQDMAKLGLPITAVFPYQGLYITRSDWSADAVYLNLLARQDAWYDRHENVDRGRFVFAALGRRWAIDRSWSQAPRSGDHSLVHIDGRGQAEATVGRGKAPNGRLVVYGDIPDPATDDGISYGVLDLKNAYDWLWTHSWESPGEGWEPERRTFKQLGWPWTRPGQPPALYGCDDPAAPRYNFTGCNLWRKPLNPVQYCWRTGILARGNHPYVIIVDDVKKDERSHLYQWYMQIPGDVEFLPQANGSIVLCEKDEPRIDGRPKLGSRRLLLAPLSGEKSTVRMEEYVSSVSRGMAHKARRVVISRTGPEGRFRILLYPLRTTIPPVGMTWREQWQHAPLGGTVPVVRPAAQGIGFALEFDGRIDQWTVRLGDDGRSRLGLERGGNCWQLD